MVGGPPFRETSFHLSRVVAIGTWRRAMIPLWCGMVRRPHSKIDPDCPPPIAWKPRSLGECGAMPPVVASLQAVIAKRAAEKLQWNGRLGNQIENPV
jgi:hypothetical protein